MYNVNNRLNVHINSWQNIGANETILNWIIHGAKIPFRGPPPQFERFNRQFNVQDATLIDEEVANLIQSGAIREVNTRPQCVSSIDLVPKKTGKKRLIVDLRAVNDHIDNRYFKNEGIEVASQHIQYGDECVTFDLKEGYHHIPIHSSDQTYLGIQWRGRYYVWQVCPFGLSSSGYFFNKTVRAVTQYLREQGLRITFFVDDGLLAARPDQITDHKDLVLHTLEELGLQVNFDKSSLDPSQVVEWVGYEIDTSGTDGNPWIYIPKQRIRKLKHDIRRVIKHPCIKAKHLARITGQCISMCKAIIPAKLKLRNLYKVLRMRSSWHDTLMLDEPAINDLIWWSEALETDAWNGAPISNKAFDVQIETDASGYGWGGYCQGRSAAGVWDKFTSSQPSNYRELLAIILTIKSFAPWLSGKKVQVLTDNISCVAYINHLGGPSTELSRLAQALWDTAYELDIELTARHLAGRLNVTADRLSRQMSALEWKLHPNLFRFIEKCFGPHTVDRFASLRTTQLPRYNSLLWDPASEAVDAMAQNWSGEINFVNAPFKMIPRILDKIAEEQATATIIAPVWPSQVWFRRLCNMTTHMPLPLPSNPRTMMKMGITPEPLRNRKWRICAWRICGLRN